MSTSSNTHSSTPNTQPNKQEAGYVESAGNALTSAAATISSYLPTSVTNAVSGLNPTATDSETAYRNQQPHTGGVGDLGTTSTQDVTRLPEERRNPDPTSGKPPTDIGASNPAFTHPVGVQNQYNNRSEGEVFPAGTSGVGAPTSHTSTTGLSGGTGGAAYGVGGHAGAPGGVGDLGTSSAQNVAVLPDERAHSAYGTSAPTNTSSTSGSTSMKYGVGGHPGESGGVSNLGTQSAADVALLPEERAHPNPFSEGKTSTTTSTTDKVKSAVSNTAHHGTTDTGYTGDRSTGASTTDRVKSAVSDTGHHDSSSSERTGGISAKDKVKAAVSGTTTGTGQHDTSATGGLGGHDGRHHDITKEGSTGGHTGASYDVDHGLGMPHTRSMAPTDTTNTTSPATHTSSTTHATENAPYSSHSTSQTHDEDVPSPKEAGYPTGKPSMMDKVKGAAIIAKAKASKDEEMIQQGQMLKETGKKINPEEEARRAGSMDTSQY